VLTVTPEANVSQEIYTVDAGESVTFECVATGIPAPSIVWSRNGSELSDAVDFRVTISELSDPIHFVNDDGDTVWQVNQTLTLTATEDGDSGSYECNATNDASPGEDTIAFELIVESKLKCVLSLDLIFLFYSFPSNSCDQ